MFFFAVCIESYLSFTRWFAESNSSEDISIPQQPASALRMAFVIIAITPIMCVYPFLQKYFVKGALIGSVKG